MARIAIIAIALGFTFGLTTPAFAAIDHNSSRSNLSKKACAKDQIYNAKTKKCEPKAPKTQKKKNK